MSDEIARLRSLPARKRLDALVEAPDARAAVRRAPVQLLYQTALEVGLADSTELVQLASPAQFRALLDLGGWDRDRLDPHDVLTWLRAARGDDPEEFLAKVRAVDVEVIELMLRAMTVVHDRDEHPDADPQGVTVETPDHKYLIELQVEGAEMSALRTLINDFIAQDPFQASRMFEAIRWEIPSELEETAYRFRTARLQDLGFPPLEEAMSLYAYVDPETVRPRTATPGLVRAEGPRPDYLAAALDAAAPAEREVLEEELRFLVNSALVADAADPGDLEAARRVGDQTRDYLALGFESLTGGDPSQAVEVVRQVPIRRVFQVGFSITLEAKHRADRVARRLFTVDGTPPLLWLERASLAALRRKRPLRALKVEGAEPVTFRDRRELEESFALLDRVERQSEVFRALLGGEEDPLRRFQARLPGLGADRLWAAILAHAVLDGRVEVAPLPVPRLDELAGRLFEGDAASPRLRAAAAERALGALAPAVPEPAREELRRMADTGLHRLLQELGAPFLREGRLDPKLAGEALAVAGL